MEAYIKEKTKWIKKNYNNRTLKSNHIILNKIKGWKKFEIHTSNQIWNIKWYEEKIWHVNGNRYTKVDNSNCELDS